MTTKFIIAAVAALLAVFAVAADQQFSGIGVTVVESVVGARVATVLPGGAADHSGQLRPHDAIIAVAEGDAEPVSLRGMTIAEIVDLIRGEPGSEIQLTVLPADNRIVKRKIIALRRALIAAPALPAAPEVGKQAPDFNFLRLDTGKRGQLSDFKDKVVVLDFWATWCGPCQAPMAKMQDYVEKYPAWRDRVVWMTLSVDRNRDQVESHLEQKQWTRTLNAWDDKGAAQLYGIEAIPQVFVIKPGGVVAATGHPGVMDVPASVAAALGEPPPTTAAADAPDKPATVPIPPATDK